MTERFEEPSPEDLEKFEIELKAIMDAVQIRHHSWTDNHAAARPQRSYSMDVDDLYPGRQITVLNTRYSGEDRLRFARHYLIIGEPFKDVVGYPKIESQFVPAIMVENHETGTPVTRVNKGISDVPLSHLGIEKDPITSLYDTSAYTVPYEALLHDSDLILQQ